MSMNAAQLELILSNQQPLEGREERFLLADSGIMSGQIHRFIKRVGKGNLK